MADIDKIKIGSTTYNISPSWNNITGKPSTYPSSSHTHTKSQITDFSHTHTKSEVGLGNVDNTADANKSVKYATTAGSANSVTWENVTGKPSTFTPGSHAHSSILDSANAHSTYFAYSKDGLNYDDYTWLAAWDNYELRAVNKSQFARADHTHNYLSNVATISGENTSNYPWRRIMSIPSTTGSWVDAVGTYYLSGNYHGGPYYLFRVAFRTNASYNGSLGNFQISVIATNSDPANLAIASYSVATDGVTTSYSDIFVKVPSYPRMTLTRLSAMDIRTINYYNSNEGNEASSRTEAYTEINGSGTGYASSELHSLSAYTYVNKGELSSKVNYANSAGSVPWGSVTNKPSTFPSDSHNHDDRYYTESEINDKLKKYLPLDGSSAMTGALDLTNTNNGIKMFKDRDGTPYYVTNIEAGSVILSGMNTASSGTTRTYSVKFHNGSKGSGSWYVVATATGSSSTFPEYVIVGVTNIDNSGFTIKARKIASSPGGSPDLNVDYVAIKYY